MKDIGHNNPPDPLDEALAPYGEAISEAENWLDGSPVENADQMKAVDALLKQIKAADKAVKDAEESEAKPIYDHWKATKARFTPTLSDLDRMKKGLASIMDAFKRKLAAEKAEAERLARVAANKAREEAERKAREAAAGDLEAQREAEAAMQAAKDAQSQAVAASKDTVKGLRKVTRYEITDHKKLLHWIAANDREAITAFIEEYARKHHKDKAFAASGLRVWDDKEAF